MAIMQYARLFQIECLHSYFGGGPCRSLALAPTEDCRQMLNRYQMFFRPAAGGGTVYCPDQTPPDLLKQFDETAPFTFALTSSDPALNNYTDVDLGGVDVRESIFYFDNRDDHATGTSGQPRQMLHEPDKPFAHGAVPVRTKISSLSASEHKGNTEFKITEPLGDQVVLQGTIPQKDSPVSMDLRAAPEGLYRLHIGSETKQFYLSDQLAVRRWGAISIYAGGTRQSNLPQNCRAIASDGGIHLKTFTLSLESRKTFWRYYIISSDRSKVSYEVVCNEKHPSAPDHSQVAFSLLEKPEEVDGRRTWVFESDSPLPLLLSPRNTLTLALYRKETKSDQEPEIKAPRNLEQKANGKRLGKPRNLPYAQPSSLVACEHPPSAGTGQGKEKRRMCSEIFVYL